MEDQQPAPGDVTTSDADPAAPETLETKEVASDDTAAAATESAEDTADDDVTEQSEDDEAEGETAEAEEETAEPGGKSRRKLLAGKRLAVAVVLAAVLFVGSAAFAGAAMQPYLSDRAVAATKLKIAETAANAVRTLFTYNPENMESLPDRAAAYLSGDFEAQYRKYVDAIVGPNKQAKISDRTDVTGAAVESLDEPNAVVIVYTNTTATTPLTKNIPSLKYFSYRLFMKRAGGRWLVNRMTTVTSLDLTPHLPGQG